MKRQTRSRRRIAFMAVGVLAACAVAVPALASHTAGSADSTRARVTIHRHPTYFHGRVVSSKHACEVHRKVELIKYRFSGEKKTIGKDRSNNRGKWKIVVKEPRRGRLLARADSSLRGTAGTAFLCHGDNSRLLTPRN